MGIQDLTRTIKKHAPDAIETLEPVNLPGVHYGVDVFSYLYPAKYNPGAKGKGQHIRFFFDLICAWRQAGKQLIMVFDGNTSLVEAKSETVQKRAEARQKTRDIIQEAQTAINEGIGTMQDHLELQRALRNNIKIEETDITELKTLFTFMNVPYYQAVGEADSLLASLHTSGLITGVITEDSDLLTHGVALVVRGLIDGKNRSAGLVNLYKLDTVLTGLKMSMSQFIDFCILSGCDYCPRIPGLGPVTALKHVSNGGTPLTCDQPDESYKDKYLVARQMFTEHEPIPAVETVKTDGDDLKIWMLKNTNFTEKTLTDKLELKVKVKVKVPVQIKEKDQPVGEGAGLVDPFDPKPKITVKVKAKVKI